MKTELVVLESDKEYIRKRIAELEAEINALGPEFYDAFNQTSETWHDNAPFEAVRDKQTLLATELHNLKHILKNSLPSTPRQKKNVVGIGSKVEVYNPKTDKIHVYFIAGDWTVTAGHKINGITTISRKSPIASILIDKKTGDEVFFKSKLIIKILE